MLLILSCPLNILLSPLPPEKARSISIPPFHPGIPASVTNQPSQIDGSGHLPLSSSPGHSCRIGNLHLTTAESLLHLSFVCRIEMEQISSISVSAHGRRESPNLSVFGHFFSALKATLANEEPPDLCHIVQYPCARTDLTAPDPKQMKPFCPV